MQEGSFEKARILYLTERMIDIFTEDQEEKRQVQKEVHNFLNECEKQYINLYPIENIKNPSVDEEYFEKPASNRPRKKTTSEVIVYASAGLVTGFVDQYIGNVIGNALGRQPNILVNNLFPESYIAGMITAATTSVFFDLDSLLLTFLAIGLYLTIIKSIKLYVGRPSLSDEELLREFLFSGIVVYLLIKIQNSYVDLFKEMHYRRYPHKRKPAPKPKNQQSFTFTERIERNLTNQFFITVYFAIRQNLRNQEREARGEAPEPTPSNPNP